MPKKPGVRFRSKPKAGQQAAFTRIAKRDTARQVKALGQAGANKPTRKGRGSVSGLSDRKRGA